MGSTVSQEQTYFHGYERDEQHRLIDQAGFWRDRLILSGTTLVPGERLLEIGSGVGAVLRVLGDAFPDAVLSGIDIAQEQIGFARSYLSESGVKADLRVAAAQDLPFPDASFDHVWDMWVVEHAASEDEAVSVLREARRVLVPGGKITAIEADYSTISIGPRHPAIEAMLASLAGSFRAFGHSDAGTQLPIWLDQAGYQDIRPGERLFAYHGTETGPAARYIADVVEMTAEDMACIPGNSDLDTLRLGARRLRELDSVPGARLSFVIHKAQARV
jgi:ubiquinone/menaquinone biosynthesis C-methylase UbiE